MIDMMLTEELLEMMFTIGRLVLWQGFYTQEQIDTLEEIEDELDTRDNW